MATKRPNRLRPATPARPNRPLRPMPRQQREHAPPRREARQRMVFGRPWPLPISPLALGLLLLFGVAAGVAWWVEGRFETTPAEAAKQVIPFKSEDVQTIELVTAAGRASFNRGADGKMEVAGPAPTPTTAPPPGATPAPVTLSPSARVESVVTQLSQLRVDRVISASPSTAVEYGLDVPTMTFKVTPKTGQAQTLAIGALSPDETSYYVRREEKRDTVLVSRYSLDDLIRVAQDVLKSPGS